MSRSTVDPADSRQVMFNEEVLVFHIERKSENEVKELFWHGDDYVRMKTEDHISSTRRARSRLREMKRRVTESAQHEMRIVNDSNSLEDEKFEHTDSMRFTIGRIQKVPAIVNTA